MTIHIRRATRADLESIVAMRQERTAWLAARGTDQWQVGLSIDGFVERVQSSINAGETYIAVDEQDTPVGTIAVDTWTNPALWSEAELAEAVIIHRMITWPQRSNKGVGKTLLEHAAKVALKAGRPWIRLDAWTNNEDLHAYYESAGFRHVRTVKDHKSKSTALFEKRARVRLPSSKPEPVDHGTGLGFSYSNVNHSAYTLDGLTIQCPPELGDSPFLQIAPGLPWRLWSQDGTWFVSPAGTGRSRACKVIKGEPIAWLNASYRYTIEANEGISLTLHSDGADTPIAGPSTPT